MAKHSWNNPNSSLQEIGALLALFNERSYPKAIAGAQKLATQQYSFQSLRWHIMGCR